MDSTIMTNTVYHGVEVDFSRDNLFDTAGLTRMRDSYMRSTEESPQERFAYVSKMFSSNPAHAQRLYGYSSKHWLSYSTPILSYGRVSYGLPISCFLPYLPDTKEGLVDNLSECNWLSMLGGGVGIQVGLRAPDKKSSGVMKHLAVYNKACSAYNQGETRRGSYAAYLDVSHPEIVNFIEMRKPTGDYRLRCHDMHHGVNIPDAFMELVEQAMYDVDFDDSWPLICPKTKEVTQVVRARDIWELIVTTRSQTGEPYMHFIDTSNRALPEWQQKKGLKINGSNLCLTGDTRIATDRGYLTLEELYEAGDSFNVVSDNRSLDGSLVTPKRWGNKIVSDASTGTGVYQSTPVILTSTKAPVFKVTTGSGYVIRGTADHGVLTTSGWKTIGDLTTNDTLLIQSGEGVWNEDTSMPEFVYEPKSASSGSKLANKRFTPPTTWSRELGEMLGWLVGDGFISGKYGYATFVIGKDDTDVVSRIYSFVEGITDATIHVQKFQSTTQLRVCDIRFGSWLKSLGVSTEKAHNKTVPHALWSAPKEAVAGFLSGLFSADGCAVSGQSTTVQLGSTSKRLIDEVQILLSNFGIRSSVYFVKDAGTSMLPDSTSEYVQYDTQPLFSLRIGKDNVERFERAIGFIIDRKNAVLEHTTQQRYKERFEDRITSVTFDGFEAVFDIVVDESHSFIANGLVVHNCSEITLATDAERTAVCCLSSVNLEYYDEWKDNYQFIRDILEMLDNVLEVFIQHAPDEIQRARYSAMRERSVGIGVMGWHALLQKRNVAFESVMAKVLNNKIFAQMREYADRANGELAVERGEAPDAVGYGKRLSHMFAIAPTATSSIILGNTSPCIEPYRANVYRQDTLSGIFFQVNKFLRKVIESKNISEERQQQIWEAIVADEGSVRNIDELTEHEKMVFRTFSEIDQMWVIEHAADRYQHIDQGQSVNVYIAPTCSIAQLHAIHFVAWKKGLKSLYYLRSNSVIGADKVSKSIRRNKSIDGVSEPEQQVTLMEETFVNLQTLIDDSECVACQ